MYWPILIQTLLGYMTLTQIIKGLVPAEEVDRIVTFAGAGPHDRTLLVTGKRTRYTNSEVHVPLVCSSSGNRVFHPVPGNVNNETPQGDAIMSEVAVQKIHSNEIGSSSLTENLKALAERVRQRAYERFERRGRGDGSALNDWLEAENDLTLTPESDLIEKDDQFQLQIAVPGFDAKDVEVNALPDALIVRAKNAHKHEQTEGNVHFCEFGERSLFRRFDLPSPIDVDKVTANLEKGLLTLTASKVEKPASRAAGAA
jgi:HSP20 family protein